MFMNKPQVITRAIITRNAKMQPKAIVIDERIKLFKRHLDATKGFSDGQIQAYLHELPLQRLRSIQVVYAHYPGVIPLKVSNLAARANEILEARIHMGHK